MTNREFFIKVIKDEAPRFRRVIEAIPEDKYSFKVHDISREAGHLAAIIVSNWNSISQVVKEGTLVWNEDDIKKSKGKELLEEFDRNFITLLSDAQNISDDDWENGDASVGEDWKTKKYDMAWGFLFDSIHHRGQLTTFLRNMGAKVPVVYGDSADFKL